MTSVFTVMVDYASSFRSVSIIDAHPCTDDSMEVNDFPAAALPLPSARVPLDDELIRQAEAEDSVGSGTPTADYAEDFIARHSEVAPATREEYMRAVRDMRRARIGEVPISMLKPSDVQDWMIWLRDERGLGPASRNKKHGVLAMVCKYAAAIGDAPIVATGLLKAPKGLPKPVNSLTESSALEVAAQLRARLPEPLALAGIIALMTGMRRGEICALRWQNWDEDRQMLLVRRTLAKGENGGFVLRDNPKDPSGRGAFRDIPVPSTLAAALSAAREAQRERIRGVRQVVPLPVHLRESADRLAFPERPQFPLERPQRGHELVVDAGRPGDLPRPAAHIRHRFDCPGVRRHEPREHSRP